MFRSIWNSLLEMSKPTPAYTRRQHELSMVPERRKNSLEMSREEKRKHYACKSKYVTLNKIPPWIEYCKENRLKQSISNFIRLNNHIKFFMLKS